MVDVVDSDKNFKQLCKWEEEVADAFVAQAESLRNIKKSRFWQLRHCQSWSEYLHQRWGKSESWYKDLQTCARISKQILSEFGIRLGNKSAAREINKLCSKNSEIVEAIVQQAQITQIAFGDHELEGKHIRAVIRTVKDILATGGYVDDGQGSMLAWNAAIAMDVQEAIMRQAEHRNNGRHWIKVEEPVMLRDLSRVVTQIVQKMDRSLNEHIEIRFAFVEA